MPKIDINKVADILKKNQVAPALLRQIVEEMNLAAQPDPGAEDAPPPVKKQFVLVVSDPSGLLPKEDFTGWAVQIPEDQSPATTTERIFRAAYEFNATKKGRLLPVSSVGEALENVPARHFKECDLWVKTKTPVLIVRTDNQIPTDEDPVKAARRAKKERE